MVPLNDRPEQQEQTLAGKAVVVTGGAGFIGSQLVERLVRDGARVRAFVQYNPNSDRDNLELAPADVQRGVEVVFGDLRDPWRVATALEGQEVVFHLGALISIPYSYQAPADYIATNVLGTLNVLEGARAAGAARVVHTSTSEVYGSAQSVPIDEEHRLHAQSPYAASKIGADQLAQSYRLSFDVPVTTIRPFNTYGPRQSARALVPTIITQALHEPEIVLGSLTPTRDLTFVEDTVDAFVRVALAPDAVGRTLNVGTGTEISVGDLVETILGITGRPVPVRQDPARIRPESSEVVQLVCDASAIAQVAGWKPRVPLEDGLRQTVAWIERHPGRYRPAEYLV